MSDQDDEPQPSGSAPQPYRTFRIETKPIPEDIITTGFGRTPSESRLVFQNFDGIAVFRSRSTIGDDSLESGGDVAGAQQQEPKRSRSKSPGGLTCAASLSCCRIGKTCTHSGQASASGSVDDLSSEPGTSTASNPCSWAFGSFCGTKKPRKSLRYIISTSNIKDELITIQVMDCERWTRETTFVDTAKPVAFRPSETQESLSTGDREPLTSPPTPTLPPEFPTTLPTLPPQDDSGGELESAPVFVIETHSSTNPEHSPLDKRGQRE